MSSWAAIYAIILIILQKMRHLMRICTFRTVHAYNISHQPTYIYTNNHATVRLLHLDNPVSSRRPCCVCIMRVQWTHTVFLSSSAEYHKAESAPCRAELSLRRAMSDNSNSTGSTGSSTNSWTLLSPEVRREKQPRGARLRVPGYNLEDGYYLTAHEYKSEIWHVCARTLKLPRLLRLLRLFAKLQNVWSIIQTYWCFQFEYVMCVFSNMWCTDLSVLPLLLFASVCAWWHDISIVITTISSSGINTLPLQ